MKLIVVNVVYRKHSRYVLVIKGKLVPIIFAPVPLALLSESLITFVLFSTLDKSAII
jgi:hypothetical protein